MNWIPSREICGVAEDGLLELLGLLIVSLTNDALTESCMPSTSAWSHDSMLRWQSRASPRGGRGRLAADECLEDNLLVLLQNILSILYLSSLSNSIMTVSRQTGLEVRADRGDQSPATKSPAVSGQRQKAGGTWPLGVQEGSGGLLAQLELLSSTGSTSIIILLSQHTSTTF